MSEGSMRGICVWGLVGIGAAVLALAACGQSGSGSSSSSSSSTGSTATTAPPPAPTLSDAQKTALVAQLPAAYRGADLSNGEAKFAVCRSCHTLNQGGEDMTGPNLWGIFGRKAGSEPGFAYSDGIKAAGWTWDADRIDKWITNPRAVLADTKMTFIGIPSATDRRDVIAFLKTQTSPAPKG
jgi:cytochrome c